MSEAATTPMAPRPPHDACGGESVRGRVLGRVVEAQRLGPLVRVTLDVPGWPGCCPGQFALLRRESSRCFLARGLSVSDEVGERVSFVIAPVGDGTVELSGVTPGDPVWVLGPLGNGFDTASLTGDAGRTVIVAGGVGLAPFPLLLTRIVQTAAAGSEVLVLLGFRDAHQAEAAAVVERVIGDRSDKSPRVDIEIVTEDGSVGQAEKVTDALARHLRPGDRVAVCGPDAMADAAWNLCRSVAGVRAWFSLETKMACGVGSCHGCVISLADGSYARVCREGPVFKGEVVFGG